MQLALLFWFYKDLDLCENRLVLLRQQNPDLQIFGLYGGPAEGAGAARDRLRGYLDDFYAFEGEGEERWRWLNGDRLIAAWHRERGRALSWDTVVVTQWDALFLQPAKQLFWMLRRGEALFSGLRPSEEVEAWWPWLGVERAGEAAAFQRMLGADYGYSGGLWCCLFIVACLPRRFLDLYADAGPPAEGFLEYRVPTMARVFGVPCVKRHPFQPWWAKDPSTLNVPEGQRLLKVVKEVSLETVMQEAVEQRVGIVHPFRAPYPPAMTVGVRATPSDVHAAPLGVPHAR